MSPTSSNFVLSFNSHDPRGDPNQPHVCLAIPMSTMAEAGGDSTEVHPLKAATCRKTAYCACALIVLQVCCTDSSLALDAAQVHTSELQTYCETLCPPQGSGAWPVHIGCAGLHISSLVFLVGSGRKLDMRLCNEPPSRRCFTRLCCGTKGLSRLIDPAAHRISVPGAFRTGFPKADHPVTPMAWEATSAFGPRL